MKIIAISDTHNHHRKLNLPEGDVLIHAGDFSSMGYEHEVYDFFEWFNSQPHKYKILVAGNHDISFDARKNKEARIKPEWVRKLLESYNDIIYLENDMVEINGYMIFGSPYTPNFFPETWAFNEGNRGLTAMYNMIQEEGTDIDIFVSHGPAHGYLDNVDGAGSVGCYALRKYIHKNPPRYHLFGHIHTDAEHNPVKCMSNGSTILCNVSVCNTQNILSWEPTVIQLERSTTF